MSNRMSAWFIVFALGLAGSGRADELLMSNEHPDYKAIGAMQGRLGSNHLPAAGAPKNQVMLALADLATQAGQTENAPADWKAKDYDALFALLQKYRDELRGLGLAQDDLERLLANLKVREDALEKAIKNLHAPDGLKIGGQIITVLDDFMVTGPGYNKGRATRYRQGIQRADLLFQYTLGPLSGLVEYDLEYVFGNQFTFGPNSQAYQGMRRISIEALLPVAIQVGSLSYKMTPLTFWRNEDTDPFEPTLFEKRDQRIRDDLFLKKDNAYRLQGIRLSSEMSFFETEPAYAQVLFAPIAQGVTDASIPGNQAIYNTAAGTPIFQLYNTYLGAWQMAVPVSPLSAKVSYQGTMLANAIDSGEWLYTTGPEIGQKIQGFDSQVHSAGLGFDFFGNSLVVAAEYAKSLFSSPNDAANYADPAIGRSGYLVGTAMTEKLAWKGSWLDLALDYRDVDQNFISAPGQGRTQDPAYNSTGPFATENILLNPSTGNFTTLNIPKPPQSIWSNGILPPELWINGSGGVSAFRAMAPYHAAWSGASPYGLATPNRKGYGADVTLKLFNGFLKPRGQYEMLSEVTITAGASLQTFNTLGAGLTIDLMPVLGWPWSFSGGMQQYARKNDTWLALNSARIGVGADVNAWQGGMLYAGWRHLDYNGTIPYAATPFATIDPVLAPLGRQVLSQIYDSWGFGLSHQFTRAMRFDSNYTVTVFNNPVAASSTAPTLKTKNYEIDEAYARLTLAF